MNLDQLIEALQAIKEKHGGDLMVCSTYDDPWLMDKCVKPANLNPRVETMSWMNENLMLLGGDNEILAAGP